MPALTFPYLGSSWSLWPAAGDDGGLNIVSGVRVISSEILSVLLVRKNEHPVMPEFGLAPELFEPLSNYAPQYWVYNARQEILRWVAGIQSLDIDILDQPDAENRLRAYITFVPRSSADSNVLTFGWYEYTGAVYNQQFSTFLDGVELNGQRFNGLLAA